MKISPSFKGNFTINNAFQSFKAGQIANKENLEIKSLEFDKKLQEVTIHSIKDEQKDDAFYKACKKADIKFVIAAY